MNARQVIENAIGLCAASGCDLHQMAVHVEDALHKNAGGEYVGLGDSTLKRLEPFGVTIPGLPTIEGFRLVDPEDQQ